jgi:single-stranded DNA-binding protein
VYSLKGPTKGRNGVLLVSWLLKVHTRTKYADGTEDHHYNLIDCIAWAARAQEAGGMLKEGSRVLVRGKVHKTHWGQGKAKRYKVEVVVDDLQELVSRVTAANGTALVAQPPIPTKAPPAPALESGPHADESRARQREPGEDESEDFERVFEENQL